MDTSIFEINGLREETRTSLKYILNQGSLS